MPRPPSSSDPAVSGHQPVKATPPKAKHPKATLAKAGPIRARDLLNKGRALLGGGPRSNASQDADVASGLEEAGLRDLIARSAPPAAYEQAIDPSGLPPGQSRARGRLSAEEAAGTGLLRNADGSYRPHYWGHRERLRQRFLTGGQEAMPEYELLELLLFNAIPRIDVKPLAKRLLETFGDLNRVVAASEARILEVEGADKWVYLQLRLVEAFGQRMARARVINREVLASWADLVAYCHTAMAHRETEQFRILFLDTKYQLIADEALGNGTINHVPVYPREVIRRALDLSAAALVLVHNHPTGDPTPSDADIDMTLRIADACATVEIGLVDHIIIGQERETSFRAEGWLPGG